MPTGKRRAARRQARGFTYLLLLFVLVAGSSAWAALASQWTTAAQRQRERESQFRGQQIADAVGRYAAVQVGDEAAEADVSAKAGAPGQGPAELVDLLLDTRTPTLQRHLRRVYEDPLTGQADWVLLRNEQGRIEGLHSRSRQPALMTSGLVTGQRLSDRIYRPRPPLPSNAAANVAATPEAAQ